MSTITKQWLQQTIAEMEEHRDLFPGDLDDNHENVLAALRIALASIEAEAVITVGDDGGDALAYRRLIQTFAPGTKLYTAPPAPVAVSESAPLAYIFKHPAGRLFWSLTDESNKGQSDVMPVYSAPVPAFVPPAIEPDYEVIKGILPTANPDEYACCIAADMWNACRDSMLQGAEPVKTAYKFPDDFDFDRFNDVVWLEAVASNPHMHSPTTSTIAMVALELNKRLEAGNSPVIPEGWVMVPVEPTEDMIVNWFESEPDESFSDAEVWEAYDAMSGCQQAAHRAKLCWSAMISAAPKQDVR